MSHEIDFIMFTISTQDLIICGLAFAAGIVVGRFTKSEIYYVMVRRNGRKKTNK